MAYTISFPAIKGNQAGRPYYSAMVPYRSLERMFYFCDEDLPQSMKAQRSLNAKRANDIAEYVVSNPDNYFLPAMTVSIDGEFNFVPAGDNPKENFSLTQVGILELSLDAKLLINDGQHRREGLIRALKRNPDLGYQQVCVVFVVDPGFHRSQQIFSDINSTAVKVAKSLTRLYDHRDEEGKQVRLVMRGVPAFADHKIEFEKNSIVGKSAKLFPYNALYEAIASTLEGAIALSNWEDRVDYCIAYWSAVARLIPEWEDVNPKELRENYLCTTALVLGALGEVGKLVLISQCVEPSPDYADSIESRINNLTQISWAKSNPEWNGRCLFDGKITKNKSTESAVVRLLKKKLFIRLEKDEDRLEKDWERTYRQQGEY